MNYYYDLILQELNRKNIYPDDIFICYRGSLAHGTYIPPENEHSTDDIDLFCIIIPRLSYYLNFKEQYKTTQEFWIDNLDIVCYELKKFVNLLLKNNPNCLSILWVSEDHIIKNTWIMQQLRLMRQDFIGLKALRNAFFGYATHQFHRMLNVEKDFSGRWMGAKRKELVEKYLYDTKAASHTLRLLTMFRDYLQEGDFYVNRKIKGDDQFFIDVKYGKYTVEDIKRYFEELEKEIQFLCDINSLHINKEILTEHLENEFLEIMQSYYLET